MIRITGIIHEDLCTFMLVSQEILLRIRNVSDRICRDNQNILFMLNFSENCAIHEIQGKNMVPPEKPQMTKQHNSCTLHAGKLRQEDTH